MRLSAAIERLSGLAGASERVRGAGISGLALSVVEFDGAVVRRDVSSSSESCSVLAVTFSALACVSAGSMVGSIGIVGDGCCGTDLQWGPGDAR